MKENAIYHSENVGANTKRTRDSIFSCISKGSVDKHFAQQASTQVREVQVREIQVREASKAIGVAFAVEANLAAVAFLD